MSGPLLEIDTAGTGGSHLQCALSQAQAQAASSPRSTRSQEIGEKMEALPVEVIGNILSRLAAARDVTIASATCRKWRDAARYHLHRLSFHHSDWSGYEDMSSEELEVVITQTILQVTCLHELSICFDSEHSFSAAPVVAWLMHTRGTLRFLTYMVSTHEVAILERCGRQKLESLVIGSTSVVAALHLGFPRFPSLVSLTLEQVYIAAADIPLLLMACPVLESFSLLSLRTASDAEPCELRSASLKTLIIEDLRERVDIVLDAGKLEVLSLKELELESLQLVSKCNLRVLRLCNVHLLELQIGGRDMLEVLEVTDSTVGWSRLYGIISEAAKLRKLKVWGLPEVGDEESINLEAIAMACSQLHLLSLGFDLSDAVLPQISSQSPIVFPKVGTLEVSSALINSDFAKWLEGMVDRCPSLTKLTVHGMLSSQLSDAKGQEDYQVVGDFTTQIVSLARKCPNLAVEICYT